MGKGLKSLLAGTALLSLAGCVTYTTTTYPSPPRYPVTVTRTEHVYFSIQNVPSHPRHERNFNNPTYNDRKPEPRRIEHHRHHDYSGPSYRK